MTRTRTYALLEVPAVVFVAVKKMLEHAGYSQAIGDDGALDMHGLALTKRPGSKTLDGKIELGTLMNSAGEGRVEIQLGVEVAQWDIADAKKVHAMLGEAIEASISDALIFKFLTEKVGIAHEKAAMLLIEFRELRQGSKAAVNPS